MDQTASPCPYRVLLPLSSPSEADALFPLAEAFVKDQCAQLIILRVIPVPEGRPLSEAALEVCRSRQVLDALLAADSCVVTQIKTVVRVARETWTGIREAVEEQGADLLILPWLGEDPEEADLASDRLSGLPCDVVVVRWGTAAVPSANKRPFRSVLLPVESCPLSSLALRTARALADSAGVGITLLHITGLEKPGSDVRAFASCAPALRGVEVITQPVSTVGEVSGVILEQARNYQAVVMQVPSRASISSGWSSPLLDALTQEVGTTLIVAPAPPPPPAGLPETEERRTFPWRERPVPAVVDKWFAENTFRSQEFADLERLLALKEEQGLKISLGLPALNEEQTVGNVILTAKRALMDEVPLLDEIVLIDSRSVDYTREIAADLGIPVHIHQEILPQYGAFRGKGECLWKSLHVLEGDIVAWIDTDIVNIHPRFIYGILGPLLRDPHLQYVKGFYRRPLRWGDRMISGGGGRVTELTARPFINLFFPELAGFIQPLAGEYAGRRDVLERLPFFTGYGVETGLLIDMFRTFGLRAIAQVDLCERIHRNQPLPSLSRMSFAIMQVFLRRLEGYHKIHLFEGIQETMKQVHYGPESLFLDTVEIGEEERPPMITLPEYRARRGLASGGSLAAGAVG